MHIKKINIITASIIVAGFMTQLSAGTDYNLIAKSTSLLIDNVDRLEANLAASNQDRKVDLDATNQEILEIRKSISETTSSYDAKIDRLNQEITNLTALIKINAEAIAKEKELNSNRYESLNKESGDTTLETRLMREINLLHKEIDKNKLSAVKQKDSSIKGEDENIVDEQKARLEAFINRQKVDGHAK